MSVRRRRSARHASQRQRSVYVEPDTDDEFGDSTEDEEDSLSDSPRASKRPRRDNVAIDHHAQPQSQPRVTRSVQSAATRSSNARQATADKTLAVKSTVGSRAIRQVVSQINRSQGRSRRKASRNSAKKPVPNGIKTPLEHTEQRIDVPTDGVKPPWASLPYGVALSIFSFTYSAESGGHNWLLRSASRICRAYTEPALSAFYQNPRVPTSAHLENLYTLVQSPQEQRLMRYQVKVRRLEVDIHAFVNHKDSADSFEFSSLISALPKLEEIFITSVQDKPPYRRHTLPRWKYSEAWFDSLIHTKLRLKSWRWNWLFVRQAAGSPRLFDFMFATHQSPAFQTITHLEISDHPEFVRPAAGLAYQEDKIAEAIGLLPSLQSLELETCDIVNARFLERLPRTLTRLRLANCEALTSDAIETFLGQDGGCQLEEIVLDHNVRLDLAFLPLLKATCHRLKRLSMDLRYYSQHHTVNDAEARYKQLLDDCQIPSWPRSLESLELLHLQKWSAVAAQNLFSSLLDSAQELPNLRSLTLQAHISISWRDRASFRDKWIDQLNKVFLHRGKDPSPDLASKKAFRIAQDIQNAVTFDRPSASGRGFSGVSIPRTSVETSEFSSPDDDEPLASSRRSRRIAASETEKLERSAVESRLVSFGSDDEDEDDQKAVFIQGLCHTVDVRIDNQRPREEQLNESHFLDSEQSGDEDWSEGAEIPDEGYAW